MTTSKIFQRTCPINRLPKLEEVYPDTKCEFIFAQRGFFCPCTDENCPGIIAKVRGILFHEELTQSELKQKMVQLTDKIGKNMITYNSVPTIKGLDKKEYYRNYMRNYYHQHKAGSKGSKGSDETSGADED